MKKMFKYIFVLCFIVLFFGCEKKTEEPEILLFEADTSTVVVGEDVTFRYQVKADYISLWTGNQETSKINRDYNKFLEQTSNPPDTNEAVGRFNSWGLVLETTDNAYVYNLYKEPGTYTAVLIATNVGKLGEEYERKEASIQVEVLEATE